MFALFRRRTRPALENGARIHDVNPLFRRKAALRARCHMIFRQAAFRNIAIRGRGKLVLWRRMKEAADTTAISHARPVVVTDFYVETGGRKLAVGRKCKFSAARR